MYIRCGHFLGTVAAENRAQFDAAFDGGVVPALAGFPGVRFVKVLRARDWEAGAPEIYQTVEMGFDSPADIEAMLISPQRAANRDRLAKAMRLFDGRILHIVYEATVEKNI